MLNIASLTMCAMNRKDILNRLINEQFDGSKSAFARVIKKSAAQVHQWTSGHRNIGDAGARHIENTLRLPQGFFDLTPRALERFLVPGIEPGPDIKGLVPLISWVQAGAWCEIPDLLQPGDAEEWLPCPVNHGDYTYVLRIRGESMYNPHARPSFYEGDLIFVDPDVEPRNGSLVIAKLHDTQEATFKKLIIEGDGQYLKALNPGWPDPMIKVTEDCHICGVVIAKMERF